MPTVDERARADLIARLGALRTFLDGVFQNGMGRHYRTIDDVTTAIHQLDEARAVALEEAARIVETSQDCSALAIAAALRATALRP